MCILTQEELEKTLFDAINLCYKNNRALLNQDFFKFIMAYFDNDWKAYTAFLDGLAQNGYIKREGTQLVYAIKFGKNAMEWRKRLANAFPDQPQQIANQTFNISHANQVQAAGRDINSFNNNDAEQLIEVLKQVVPQNPTPNSLSQKVRTWLDCGNSAMDILKGIASLI